MGSWDVSGDYRDDDGHCFRYVGEWHFAWVLDGSAVQDVLTLQMLDETGCPEPTRGAGTTVRVYDPELNAWHMTWMGPASR